MPEVHLARRPDRDHLGKAGLVDVEERVRTQMLGNADCALPDAVAPGQVDMLWPDADGLDAVFGRFGAFDQVHLGRADEARDENVPGRVVKLQRRADQAEVGSVRTMLGRVKDRFDLDPERPIADAAYGSGPMLDWLVKRDIKPHIPVLDQSGRKDGTWSRADFEWDAENDQNICPEGEALKQFRRNYSDPNRGPSDKGVAKYRALKLTCQACPSKAKCCPNADARKITREEHEDARQVARDIAKTKQYAVSMRLRKKVEMLFAHLKRILGLGRLRLRGPCGANDEFFLAETAQNLRKLAKIFPAPQQMRKA